MVFYSMEINPHIRTHGIIKTMGFHVSLNHELLHTMGICPMEIHGLTPMENPWGISVRDV